MRVVRVVGGALERDGTWLAARRSATMREPDGLALSSRNLLLNAEQRAKAPRLRELLAGPGTLSEIRAELEAEGFRVDYVEERFGRRFAAA